MNKFYERYMHIELYAHACSLHFLILYLQSKLDYNEKYLIFQYAAFLNQY